MKPTSGYALWQMEAIGDSLIREEDKRELASWSGSEPGLALVESVVASKKSWLCYARDTFKLICVFGYSVEPTLKGICVWVVGTENLYDYRHEFTSVSTSIMNNWLNKFGAIYNLIDLRNVTHVQWLIQLGFELPPDQQAIMKDGPVIQYFHK